MIDAACVSIIKQWMALMLTGRPRCRGPADSEVDQGFYHNAAMKCVSRHQPRTLSMVNVVMIGKVGDQAIESMESRLHR